MSNATMSTDESYRAFLTAQGFSPEEVNRRLGIPLIVCNGPYAFHWHRDGRNGKVCRSRREAILDYTQRCIYAMCNE